MQLLLATLSIALLLASPALADEPEDEGARKDEAARAAVLSELTKLSELAASANAFGAARAELELALATDRKVGETAKAAEELRGKTGTIAPGFAASYALEQKKAYERCLTALAEAIAAIDREQQPERWSALVSLADRFPGADVATRFDAGYFEPYDRWCSPANAKKLEAGGELIDGKWVEKAQVAELDRKHASMTNPWLLSDECHEMRTNVPLRKARRLMTLVTLYRRHFLARFSGILHLKAPEGKLPIVMTARQAELRAACAASGYATAIPMSVGAACYLIGRQPRNPCFCTFEPNMPSGPTRVPIDCVIQALTHEITHQIVFEYTRGQNEGAWSFAHYWCVEGLASYMAQWKLERGRFRLARAERDVPVGEFGENRFMPIDLTFAWTIHNKGSLPSLERLMGMDIGTFLSDVTHYHVAGTLVYFLLEGEGGKYRRQAAKLIEAAHAHSADGKSFETCFEGTDLATVEREFTRFVASGAKPN